MTALLVVEPEFAATLKAASRPHNTLSPVLRKAWDGGALRILTRKDPLEADDSHVSIVAHITEAELSAELSITDSLNGFGNRFLWALVRRSKSLPEGGSLSEDDLDAHVRDVQLSLRHARASGRMERDSEARALWCSIYEELSEGEAGLVGSLTARAEAQVTRLSMIYALLDGSSIIREEHLRAALAMWKYSRDSARFLFGDAVSDGVADKILQGLRATHDGLTRTEITNLFSRHQSSARIEQALESLHSQGLATKRIEPTGAKPVERWASSPSSQSSQPLGWPQPSEDMYHGVVGRIIETLDRTPRLTPSPSLFNS